MINLQLVDWVSLWQDIGTMATIIGIHADASFPST